MVVGQSTATCLPASAARNAAWNIASNAAWNAPRAAWNATRNAARHAALAISTRHLIGTNDYTQEHYDLLIAPWAKVIGETK